MRTVCCVMLLVLLGALPAAALDDRSAAGLHHLVKQVVEERQLPGATSRQRVAETDYDMVGNLRALRRYQDGEFIEEEVYAYAPSGRKSECSIYNETRVRTHLTRFAYDAQGRPARKGFYAANPNNPTFQVDGADDSMYSSETLAYDTFGRIASVIETPRWGAASRMIFSYNTNGYLTSTTKTTTARNGLTSVTVRDIAVDAQGRPKLETLLNDGRPVARMLILYNAQGEVSFRCLEQIGQAPVQESYAYTYDHMGNWITRVTYRILPGMDTPAETFARAETTYRTISYYP